MHRLQLHYTLTQANSQTPSQMPSPATLPAAFPAQVRNPLIDLLSAVAQAGSISAAARKLDLSYRHVWGELKRWQDMLGHELIVWEKGQSARLTEFASKLLWAEAQAQARLAPQIEALRSELERTFAVAFDDAAHVVTLYASHDDALGALREHALLQAEGALHLDIRFTGSVDAIRALNEGRCVMAGFHTQDAPGALQSGSLAERTYKPLLQPGRHKIIGFAKRTQGLIVAAGNPLRLTSLHDVAARRSRFANRALGTGTRVLLDDLLAQAQLRADQIQGYDHHEPSHAAVAQAVAGGAADVGLGIAAAAHARGLGFVELAQETYHLVCLKDALEQAPVAALRQLLASTAWQQVINQIAGYKSTRSGEVLALSQVLPWWSFKGHKRGRANGGTQAKVS